MAYDLCCTEADLTPALEAGVPFCVQRVGLGPSSATVLLVEDDALVRECLREVLDERGGWVSDAASAAQALEQMAAEGVPDVLVTDLQLGQGLNGLALIAAARQRWPGVRAVLISGTDMAEPALDPGDRFLRKPFDVDALARAVSELIAGQAGL